MKPRTYREIFGAKSSDGDCRGLNEIAALSRLVALADQQRCEIFEGPIGVFLDTFYTPEKCFELAAGSLLDLIKPIFEMNPSPLLILFPARSDDLRVGGEFNDRGPNLFSLLAGGLPIPAHEEAQKDV